MSRAALLAEVEHLRAELAAARAREERLLGLLEQVTAPKTRSTAAERQAAYRAREKAKRDVTGDVTSDVTRDVTRDAPPSPPPVPPPPPSAPTSPTPFIPLPSLAGGAGAPTATEGRPPLELHSQPGGKKPRAPSKAEVLFARLEQERQEACRSAGVDFTPEGWPPARQNATLAFLVKKGAETEQERFFSAWDSYLEEPANVDRDPPFSLGFFLASRATWESKAKRAGGAA